MHPALAGTCCMGATRREALRGLSPGWAVTRSLWGPRGVERGGGVGGGDGGDRVGFPSILFPSLGWGERGKKTLKTVN